MCVWMPHTVLNNLQRAEEECHLVIEDTSKDIERDGEGFIREWVSRTGKCNAVSLHDKASKDLVELPHGKHALDFHKNRYIIDEESMGSIGDFYKFMCVTFRVQADEEQVVTSTYDPDNPDGPFYEISTTSTEIKIHGLDDMGHPFSASIHHDTREWTTLFVEWMPCDETKERCNYMINNDSST